MKSFLYDLTLITSGAVLSQILDRVFRWRRARIKHETALLSTHALDDASFVFKQAISMGGRLSHPWDHHGKTLYCDQLESVLRTARSRIKDKMFRETIDHVISEIRSVWAAAHVGQATVAYSGMPPNPGDSAREKVTQSKADTQLLHARAGVEVADKARDRLSKLELHT